jgi:glucosyl-dolichyl phosphate glucuronosyltransferase
MQAPAESETSVVVSTYNEERWDDLAACIRSLDGQTLPPLETIVVVDHNPSLLERARETFPEANVVPNTRSRGLAGARNTGTRVASGQVVAFIDDDAQAQPSWLERLEGCFGDPAVVGAGGALLPRWERSEARWIPHEFYWVFGCSYTGLPQRLAPVRNPIGANMAVRRSVLGEVEGFREGESDDAPREIRSRGVVRAAGNIPDDTDLAIRVKQRFPRGTWLYQPLAPVFHTVTPERASFGYFLRRCYEEGVGKANLSHYVGSRDGLQSERRHLMVVLPRGVARGIRDLLGGDRHGGLRAGAIVIGLLATATGFLTTALRGSLRPRSPGNGR